MLRIRTIWLLAALASAGASFACRLDMHVQPRINPLARSDFFPDQRGARPVVEGTVARGQLHEDIYFYTGKMGSAAGDMMPIPVTREFLERGRERYNIFCSPCHSPTGDGNGFIPSRGFSKRPPSYHIDRLRKEPLGHFYDVATNGYGIMLGYASQIPPGDRWAIVAYIRALQLSQDAGKADVPSGQAVPSPPPNLSGVDASGATLPKVSQSSAKTEERP